MTALRHIVKTGNTHLALAILRVFFGSIMMYHGMTKIFVNQTDFIQHVTQRLQLPEFFAWLAIAAEFGGGALLVLGLFSRIASLFVIVTMLVAIFGTHAADPFSKKELALSYLVCGLIFFISGGGLYSMDSKLSERN